MSRLTKRKKRILDVLKSNSPPGIAMLNELRSKCLWIGNSEDRRVRSHDQKRSFNRTVLQNFNGVEIFKMDKYHSDSDKEITAGLFARWAVWEFIDQGFLSSIPLDDEIELLLGRDACSGFVKLKSNHSAVVGTAAHLSHIILVSTEPITIEKIEQLSLIPWPLKGFQNGKEVLVPELLPLARLDRLPSAIALPNHLEISTSRKKYRFF